MVQPIVTRGIGAYARYLNIAVKDNYGPTGKGRAIRWDPKGRGRHHIVKAEEKGGQKHSLFQGGFSVTLYRFRPDTNRSN